MNVDNTLTGLKATLDGYLSDITVHETLPSQVNPPCVLLAWDRVEYLDTFDEQMTAHLKITVVAAKGDLRTAQDRLHQYAELSGPYSIPAAVNTDRTLGGSVDDSKVVEAELVSLTIANQSFVGLEFTAVAVG